LRFKVDENLPGEYASILREAAFDADTVFDEKLSGAGDSVLSERCRAEDRVLMTLDLDFANVQAYPPMSHSGIVVFRSKSQDKPTLVAATARGFHFTCSSIRSRVECSTVELPENFTTRLFLILIQPRKRAISGFVFTSLGPLGDAEFGSADRIAEDQRLVRFLVPSFSVGVPNRTARVI
jgi:hypothetical protein